VGTPRVSWETVRSPRATYGFRSLTLSHFQVSKSKAVELKVFEVSLSCPGSQSACEAQNLPHLHLFIWYLFPETDFGNSGGGRDWDLRLPRPLSHFQVSKSKAVELKVFEV
jgi:hypothetical protein